MALFICIDIIMGSSGISISMALLTASPRELMARPRTRAMRATINAKLAPVISWAAFTVTRVASEMLDVPGKYVGAKPSDSVLFMPGIIIMFWRLFALT